MDIIDVETHFAGVYPLSDKSSMSIATALIDFWTNHGMPDYLQMDNELSFRGSNRYPRSLGLVLRLALSFHITPIFIPTSEPWRNGVIEKFNHNMQRHFLKTQVFRSLDEMQIEAKNFSAFHNNNHRYSSQQNKTPFEIVEKQHQVQLKNEVDLSKKMALIEGVVIFIRFIRSNAKLKILDSEFKLNKQLVYSYVVAKIIIEQHVLIVLQDHKIYHIFPFNMPVDW